MKHAFCILVFIVWAVSWAVSPLSAQNVRPKYVVIAEAEAEIGDLRNLNAEMAARNAELEEENQTMNADIARRRDFIVQADGIIDRLSASAGEIYTSLQSVVDTETRRELRSRMEDNRRSRYDLENRKRQENEAIGRSNARIDNNRKVLAVNRVRTRANDQRIQYLQACIDLSSSENRDVSSVLDKADAITSEVENLLNP